MPTRISAGVDDCPTMIPIDCKITNFPNTFLNVKWRLYYSTCIEVIDMICLLFRLYSIMWYAISCWHDGSSIMEDTTPDCYHGNDSCSHDASTVHTRYNDSHSDVIMCCVCLVDMRPFSQLCLAYGVLTKFPVNTLVEKAATNKPFFIVLYDHLSTLNQKWDRPVVGSLLADMYVLCCFYQAGGSVRSV